MNASPKKKYLRKRISRMTYDATNFFKLAHSMRFRRDIIEARKRFDIDFGNFSEVEKDKELYDTLIHDFRVHDRIHKILDKYNLSINWFQAIFDNFIFERDIIVDDKFIPDGIKISAIGKEFILLSLGKDSTLAEMTARWPAINKALFEIHGRTKTRRKPSSTFLRDHRIFQLYREGKKDVEISTQIFNETGEDLKIGNILTIISRFKKNYR